MVTLVAEAIIGPPVDRAAVTITGLGIGDSVVTLWRTADGERNPVRGARRATMNDATYVVDWDAPLGRPVTYELEVISGPSGPSRPTSNTITINSTTGFILDPLIPQTAVAVIGGEGSDVYLRPQALAALEYRADVKIFDIMGSSKPLALFGPRMAEKGVDTSVGTHSAEQNARLVNLFKSTAQLLFKPLPAWGSYGLPGTAFLANAVAKQLPVDVSWGGQMTWWDLQSDVVAAPTIKVLTATFTYGDVEILFETYQQKLDSVIAAAAAAGEAPTYLFDMKTPIG
jgi:hypothetical protein